MNNHLADFAQTLAELKAIGQFRQLPQLDHQGKMIVKDGRTMLNMSSNDYLGLANDDALKSEFLKTMAKTYRTLLPLPQGYSRIFRHLRTARKPNGKPIWT